MSEIEEGPPDTGGPEPEASATPPAEVPAADVGERPLTIPELAELRSKTQAISDELHGQISGHLETLRPLFAPRRLLGKFSGGSARRDDVAGAEKAVSAIKARYKELAGKPFGLKTELADDALTTIDPRVELYAWEYAHEASGGGETKTLSITSPVRWVMSFASGYTLHQVREVIAGRAEKRSGDLQQFVVNALVMGAIIQKFPPLVRLLEDLRFEVGQGIATDMRSLPLVSLSSNLPSFRPPDDLLVTATGFSGVDAFIELVDRGAVEGMRDPLRERLAAKLG
jgi:hypothetical protein